jgi:hypothetical protein
MNAGAFIGLAIMTASETATLVGLEPFPTWNTPICWTGFILFGDSIVYRARGHSWLHSAPRELAWLALASIPLWLVFEFYNLFIDNWHYVGLPEDPVLRYLGYAWSFGTIWPAIFVGAELVSVARHPRPMPVDAADRIAAVPAPPAAVPRGVPAGPKEPSRRRSFRLISAIIGFAMLVWPLLWPSPYLAAPVWLGFIFLLDPINERLGAESLIGDLEQGST